jgi:hypothetical protein
MSRPATNAPPRIRPSISGRALSTPPPERLLGFIANAEAAIAEPFRGITTDGQPIPGLFPIRSTGVSTVPIRLAVEAFLASLGADQVARARFPVESDAWRRWSNIHACVMRHGLLLDDLAPVQLDRAFDVLAQTLSERGFRTARDIMRLNHSIAEITGRWDECDELLYWLSVMGVPSDTEPWGWQIDGHHLIVNAFVLGDQLVTTPSFMGSEPVWARSGKYAGTRVFEEEERAGLAMMRSLDTDQRRAATIGEQLPYDVYGGFSDNVVLPYAGLRADRLTVDQRDRLLALIEVYVGRTRPDHAAVTMAEVLAHIHETHVAWIGGCEEDSVFYYRVHSPAILIEFDHQWGVALAHDGWNHDHIHTVVRTPNGNDYGRDLLRQHHLAHDHNHPHSHHLTGERP